MQATISAVVLTKNEEKNIVDCLKSLSWCDEIIVIDDESSDQTVALAKKYKAQVYSRPLGGNFSAQRNYGLQKAQGEWVLFIDADERVSLSLNYEILNTVTNIMSQFVGYKIKRFDTMWDRKLRHGETAGIQLLRLAKKTAGTWNGEVHETWRINGKIGTLQNPIEHFPHQSVKEFLAEINRYTDIRAAELFAKHIRGTAVSIVIYPSAKFIKTYLIQQGFRDGVAGLVMCLMMSLHSFLVRAKLWSLWSKKSTTR